MRKLVLAAALSGTMLTLAACSGAADETAEPADTAEHTAAEKKRGCGVEAPGHRMALAAIGRSRDRQRSPLLSGPQNTTPFRTSEHRATA